MKGKREYIDYLRDILDAAEKAERFAAGMTIDAFERDDKTVFAVVRALEIIGEATKHSLSSAPALPADPLACDGRDARQGHSRLFRDPHSASL